MASFLLVFALCLVVQSAVAEDCKTGRSVVEDIDVYKIQKSWNVVYVNNNELWEKFSCWVSDYSSSPDGGLQLQVSIVDNSNGQNNTFQGTYEKVNGHFLNYILSDNAALSSLYEILAVDYLRFKVVGGCPGAINGQPAVGIAFPRTWTPSEADLKAAKEALAEIGLDFEDFKPFCPLSEIKE
ncbi:allergen Bla g 4-like [Periplaneta americana]|uniref:allergen Bla g 4-like n=1 Tax=Periplaneta americana TaxID=6978 RepID=UPI0037E8D721